MKQLIQDEEGLFIPEKSWFTNLNKVGNIGSASIYLILEEFYYLQVLVLMSY